MDKDGYMSIEENAALEGIELNAAYTRIKDDRRRPPEERRYSEKRVDAEVVQKRPIRKVMIKVK